MKKWVSIYAVTRHYGGPEEGGWWYDRGQLLEEVCVSTRGSVSRGRRCKRIAEALKEKYSDLAHGNIGSVLGGLELSVSISEEPGSDYPSERPRYE